MSRWPHRIHGSAGQAPLRDAQSAVERLAEHAGLGGGRARVVFQVVTDVALLGTVLISGVLAAVHLYRALRPRHKGDQPNPDTATADGSPPRRNGRPTAADRGGYEDEGHRSR